MQWGKNGASNPSGITIRFNITFTPYIVVAAPTDNSQTSKIGIGSITTSSFRYYRADGAPGSSMWFALGNA